MGQSQIAAIEPGPVACCYEQRIAASNQFNGDPPSLSTIPFVPYQSDVDGIVRSADPTAGTTFEGDEGGLFTFDHLYPIVIEQVLGDLGTQIDYTMAITNGTDESQFYVDNSQYVRLFMNHDRIILMPGESFKFVTTGATVAMWLRVYATTMHAAY